MSEPPTLLVARTKPAYNNAECMHLPQSKTNKAAPSTMQNAPPPEHNQQSSAQYDAERTSLDQNQQSSAQYDAKRTSPDQNPHNSAQYDAKRTSPDQNPHSSAHQPMSDFAYPMSDFA